MIYKVTIKYKDGGSLPILAGDITMAENEMVVRYAGRRDQALYSLKDGDRVFIDILEERSTKL